MIQVWFIEKKRLNGTVAQSVWRRHPSPCYRFVFLAPALCDLLTSKISWFNSQSNWSNLSGHNEAFPELGQACREQNNLETVQDTVQEGTKLMHNQKHTECHGQNLLLTWRFSVNAITLIWNGCQYFCKWQISGVFCAVWLLNETLNTLAYFRTGSFRIFAQLGLRFNKYL